MLRQLFVATLWACFSLALHESDVGVVDWHVPQIGLPLIGSPDTAPTLHSLSKYVIAATSSDVIAALHPSNGTIAWRYFLNSQDQVQVYQTDNQTVTLLSGPGGSTLRRLDIFSGDLLLEQHLHSPAAARTTLPQLGGAAIELTEKQAYILTNGSTIRSIEPSTGALQWSWTEPDGGSRVIYSRVVASQDVVFLIGMATTTQGWTMHATALSASDGSVLATQNIPSSLSEGAKDAFFVVSNSTADSHVVAWLEDGQLRFVPLKPELHIKGKYTIQGTSYKSILDVGLSRGAHIMALTEDGSGHVLKLDGEALRPIWQYVQSASSPQYTESHYAGFLDEDGLPRIARVFWAHAAGTAVAHVYSPHLTQDTGILKPYSFSFTSEQHGVIVHVAAGMSSSHFNLLVTATTGSVQLWQDNELQWTREESLASISQAELVELPEKKVLASHFDEEEGFVTRILRHVHDAKNFPEYLVAFVKRFTTGSYATATTTPETDEVDDTADTISRDAFGFRQIIVAATPHGKIFGLDSRSGKILWSRLFGLGWAAAVGGQVLPVKVFVTRTAGDGDTPQVVVVTQRRASNTLVDTVIFHLDAVTGEDVLGVSPRDAILEGYDIIQGPLIDAYLVSAANKTVMLLDEFLQVHTYPSTPSYATAFSHLAPSISFATRTGGPGWRQLMGHQVIENPSPLLLPRHISLPTWTTALPPGEEIISIISPNLGPVASYGKVLGNRKTLYKYLNAHLGAVITQSAPVPIQGGAEREGEGGGVAPPICSVYLLDNAKGTIVYHAVLPSSEDGQCDVKATLTENWLVYHYYDATYSASGTTKGYRMVSVELYEGKQADDKTGSADMSSFSEKSISLNVYEQSYIFPHPITAITTTSTKFSISNKNVIVATPHGKVMSIPRRALDPRRPKRKMTAEDAEEFLIQYDPLLPDDSRHTLSHYYKVANVRKIITSPALLESTSLVFAYGTDLFLTRTAPSNTFDVLSEDFNKIQLVLTIAGLAVAILFTRPIVNRKRLRERWYK